MEGRQGYGGGKDTLRQKALVGVVVKGSASLGYFPKTQVSQALAKKRHSLTPGRGPSRCVGRVFGQQECKQRWESSQVK